MEAVVIGVGAVLAGGLLALLRGKYKAIDRELQREIGWHRMWTERVMDETE